MCAQMLKSLTDSHFSLFSTHHTWSLINISRHSTNSSMKNILSRYIPDAAEVKQSKVLRWFGDHIHDPNLWHLTRRSVPGAFAIGLFCAFIPSAGQMVIASALAIYFRKNLPLSFALVWISNPITIPPFFYMAYLVGTLILGIEPLGFDYFESLMSQIFSWNLNWKELWDTISSNWQPLLLGCAICGTISALVGYFGISLLWRLSVARKLKHRRKRRQQRNQTD